MRPSRSKLLAGTLVAATVGLGTVYLTYFTPDSPPPLPHDPGVSSQSLIASSEEGGLRDHTGRWVVGPGSLVGYRVREKLMQVPATREAVGRTEDVSGRLTVTKRSGQYFVEDIRVEADLTTLASDSPRRDRALQERGLETERFPTATFESDDSLPVPGDVQSGIPIEVVVEGELTIHGVTRQISIPVRAQLDSTRIDVVGTVALPLGDFDIEPPSVANLVSVEPYGTLEFHLRLNRQR